VIPGPHECALTELNVLWKDGIIVKADGSTANAKFHAALLCVGCDIPAARKVYGFTGHGSNKGCSKCKRIFPVSVGTKIDFSSNNEHRLQVQEILNQTTAGDCTNLEELYGTRYTELTLLAYFDCVRFHIIDPMHNLFTGTAKHIMKNVWLDPEKPLLDKNNLQQIQEKMDKLKVPARVGRMPKKIKNSCGGFTADQWKSFTVLFSIHALWNILPHGDLEVWLNFVLACSYLCSTVPTETRALLNSL